MGGGGGVSILSENSRVDPSFIVGLTRYICIDRYRYRYRYIDIDMYISISA